MSIKYLKPTKKLKKSGWGIRRHDIKGELEIISGGKW